MRNQQECLRPDPSGLSTLRAPSRRPVHGDGFDDVELACQPNLVALLFRLENCRQRDRIEELVSTLVSRLRGSEHDSLRRAFAVWLERVILARLSTGYVSKANELWERQAMLSDWFDEREKELRQEGEVRLLLRLLQKRFGELPESIRTVLKSAQTDQLEHWGERIFDVTSLDELFSES